MDGGRPEATYIIQAYIARGLKNLGHRVTFVVPHYLDRVVCTDDLSELALAPRTWSSSRWFGFLEKAAWHVQRWLHVPYLNVFLNLRLYDACMQCLPGCDVVYERNGLYKNGVAKACKRLKIPYVLYFEADDILEHDYMGKPITGLLRWRAKVTAQDNLDAANCIICVSEPAKKHLVSQWHVPPEKVVVFPNVADVHRFRPDPVARAEVRAALGLGDAPLAIFVGNFYEWHDVSTLLEALAALREKMPEVHLVLVGDGDRRQAMERRANELGLDGAVHFTGLLPHEEVPRFLAAADVAVVPYPALGEDLWLSPLKLYEYMAAGTAVIASAVGQLTTVIQDGQNGLLVPPGDVSAMASALQRLLQDPAFCAQLGHQARQDAEQKHSWEHYLSRLERLFSAFIVGQPVDQI
ncbi:MAG TPA: glycosyltransferase family 4 protein [Chloroflexota bacterium]|nr:glycosyltransferase family 4 protein [Chloroflexota bacterium]